MALSLSGRRAIVFAAASDIGRIVAETLAEAGARVGVCDVDQQKVAEMRQRHPAIGATATKSGKREELPMSNGILPPPGTPAGVWGKETSEFLGHVEWWIATWHAISAPNENARRGAAQLEKTIHEIESMRGTLRFEDEPASFNAALIEAKGQAR
ncbi:hypothetical protein [Mesorhizobium sp.]|uniref:hypothetical protein n=1 Tax=Mesorhizobium sp. TaxID=1871066 RepID=UPI00257997D1|nr:hypothetical protein [Mesorhizobium sp.]